MMGQTLSEPITDKETIVTNNDHFYVASSSMQGWRVTMEDAHTILLEAPADKSCAFFGVFDGHGGSSVANFASRHLHHKILTQKAYIDGDVKTAIEQGYLSLDALMKQDPKLREAMAGSTAVVILIKGSNLYCGNAGDSRAIAFIKDEAIALSTDHKPTLPEERARIVNAGFHVEFNRVNGNLAVSRALGDFMFKNNPRIPPAEQAVTSFPDVRHIRINPDWQFILLACDGIWDVMTTQEVGVFINSRIDEGIRPEDIVEDLLDACISPDGQMGGIGSDNMTVILIVVLRNMTLSYKEQLKTAKNTKNRRSRRKPKPCLDDPEAAASGIQGIDLK